MICPLISNGNAVMQCHPHCALLTKEGCAIRILADAKIDEKEKKRSIDD